jgi:23S rRNA G2445 N2-methylase RlmL
MCGCGTIPIEAAQADHNRPPETEISPALTRLRFLEPARYAALGEGDREPTHSLDISGHDIDKTTIASARRNAVAAGLGDAVTFETADATKTRCDADVIVTDMPFGIRTEGNIHSLYAGFFDQLETSDWQRLVVHTARADLVPFEPTREIEMRRGRLETVILIIE